LCRDSSVLTIVRFIVLNDTGGTLIRIEYRHYKDLMPNNCLDFSQGELIGDVTKKKTV
jgi:hypothetical protein